MKILLVTRGYPSERHLQHGCFEATQARALEKLGHEVIVIALNFYSILNWDILGSRVRKDGNITIYEEYHLAIPAHRFMPKEFMTKFLSKRLDKIYKKVEAIHGRPDIVHSHYLLISSFATILKTKYKLPLVCTEHWSMTNNPNIPSVVKKLALQTYSKADCILAVSKATSKSIMEKFGFNATTLYNMVEDDFFNIVTEDKTRNEFTFVSIGEMADTRKGFDILIQAFARYISKGETGHLNINGEGPQKEKLLNLAKKLNIADKITFTGGLSHNDLKKLIYKSDAMIMSSRIETFGVVLIEAMAAGKPVVATKCGGPEEFVEDFNGLLVDVEDVDGLCEAMIKIKNNYMNYNSELIRQKCLDNFSQKSIASKIVNYYQKILSNN